MSKQAKRKPAAPKRPKSKLGVPDLHHSNAAAVLGSLRSPESKRSYRHALDEFLQWYCPEPRFSFNKVVVTRYRIFFENGRLAAATIQWPTYGRPSAGLWKLRTPACSAQNWQPASDESKVPRS